MDNDSNVDSDTDVKIDFPVFQFVNWKYYVPLIFEKYFTVLFWAFKCVHLC